MSERASTGRSLLNQALRKLNHHRTTELYFVGYPKTGNTWVRYMLGQYVQLTCELPELPLFDATDRLGRCESFCVGPAMQFTHRPLLWRNQLTSDLNHRNVVHPFKDKRVVLLIRHPLDTLVSHWMQRKYQRVKGYDGALLEFLDDQVWGLEKYFRFYSLWFQNREHVRDFLLLRYEDLHAEPQKVFARLLDHLNIPLHEGRLVKAVTDANFESMKRIELAGAAPRYRSSGLKIFATGNRDNPDAFHVRRGKVDGFRDYLEAADIRRLMDVINQRLPPFFGYR